jgi:hypothetical protein
MASMTAGKAPDMEEITPGLWDWTTFHDGIGLEVHSHFHAGSGTLIDPRVPPEGLGWFERRGAAPQRIVLTNRHHHRHSAQFAEAFGCPVLCHEAGLDDLAGHDVQGFAFGDELAPGVRALEVGVLTPEETALHIADGPGALALADAITRGRHGDFGFFSDELLGDDPQAVKDGLRAALRRLARDEAFEALLLAHGAPVRSGAPAALLAFADLPTAGAPPG